jgi:hypothetical protein
MSVPSGPSAGLCRRLGLRPKRRAVQVIQPLRDRRQPKRVLLPVEVDARRRQGFLPCRHPSRACPIEPPPRNSIWASVPSTGPTRTVCHQARGVRARP